MSEKKYIVGNATSKELAETLKRLPYALSIIEQLIGGMAIRSNYEHVKEIVDGLLAGVPFPGYPINAPSVIFRGRIENTKKTLNKMSEFSYVPQNLSNNSGRCHRPKSTILYGALTLDTVLSELRPEIGDLVHIGVAGIKSDAEIIITSIGEIDHIRRFGRPLIGDNESIKILNKFLLESDEETKNRILLVDAFFSDVFSKSASKQREYKITNAISEHILAAKNELNPSLLDGFAYPSVAHRGGINVVIKPESFDRKCEWKEFFAIEITDYLGFGLYGRNKYAIATACSPNEALQWDDV